MTHSSFLSHARFRFFWLSLGLGMFSVLLYVVHEPNEPPNGGTWLGYVLGTVGAFLILWLAYLGRRKRNFLNGSGTVRGWVSAHVYLGSILIVIGTLHTGFQFGWNIHTLAYILMCIVIFSGFYGVFAYSTLPTTRNNLKDSQTLDEIFVQVEDRDTQILKLVGGAIDEVNSAVTSAIDRTVIGGGYREQLFGIDRSLAMIRGRLVSNSGQQAILDFLIEALSRESGETRDQINQLLGAMAERKKLLDIIRTDINVQARTSAWLLVHVPITFALIASLIAHVFSVFIYW